MNDISIPQGTDSEYVSLSLADRPRDEWPQTLCTTCPASNWFFQKSWQCFCSEFKRMVRDTQMVAPITRCDGREFAIIRMNQTPSVE